MRLVGDAARWIGRTIFRKNHVPNQLPAGFGHASAVLASHLSGVENSSFIWCTCPEGDFLKPVVHANGEGVEVVALICLGCAGRVPVNCGVLVDGNAADPETHSIH
jgi:hypothetical protein